MSQTARTPALWLIWMALKLGACSAMIDVSGRQCETDKQCRDRQLGDVCSENVCITPPQQSTSGVDGTRRTEQCVRETDCSGATPRCMRGTCVSEAVAELFLCRPPEDPPIDQGTVRYEFKVIEYVMRAPPANISAKACRVSDVQCTRAILPVSIDQETGQVVFELPRGFLGFFEVLSDAMPALSYLTKPIEFDKVDRPLQLSAPQTFMTFAMLDGAEIDDTKGVALLEAFDCQGMPVGGVHFEASVEGARPFYIVNHVPNNAATVTSYDPTSMVADGGFMNVEPGFVTFSARYGVGGPMLGSFNVAVRTNTFTFIDMYF